VVEAWWLKRPHKLIPCHAHEWVSEWPNYLIALHTHNTNKAKTYYSSKKAKKLWKTALIHTLPHLPPPPTTAVTDKLQQQQLCKLDPTTTTTTTTTTTKSISSGAQYVTLRKYFSHPSFSYVLFCNPTNKTETGTAKQIGGGGGTTNNKPLGAIIMIDQSETLSSSNQIIFITLFFFQVHSSAAEPCTKPRQLEHLCWAKTIFLRQTGICWDFFIHFYSVCTGSHTEHRWRLSKCLFYYKILLHIMGYIIISYW
jgi:hypothetical protein